MAFQTTPMCKECGWSCKSCTDQTNLHLHVEIENLKQRLLEREHHIVSMETNFLAEADKFPNGEYAALTEELLMWQDKYSRLYESYKRVQKVNQNLEDKLLKIVDKCETEKASLLREVATLSQQLTDSRSRIMQLQSENESYRNDVNLAIQLLQCKPNNFVPQRYDSLPADLQQKVLSYIYMCGRRRAPDSNCTPIKLEMKTIKVPIPSSPPTAMVYSVNKNASESDDSTDDGMEVTHPQVDSVSAAIMAKVLEDRQRERQQLQQCESHQCAPSSGNIVDTRNGNNAVVQVDMACLWCGQRADLGKTVIDVTNRSSQGLVRYVDVVATRTGEPLTRANHMKQSECIITNGSTNNNGNSLTRLGVKIEGSKHNLFAGSTVNCSEQISAPFSGYHGKNKTASTIGEGFHIVPSAVTSMAPEASSLPAINGFAPNDKEKNHKPLREFDTMLKKNLGSKTVIGSTVNNGINNSPHKVKLNNLPKVDCNDSKQNYTKHNVNSSERIQSCIVEHEIVSDSNSDTLPTGRTKDFTNKSRADSVSKGQAYLLRNSAESSGIKVNNWEGRSYLNNDQSKALCSEGTRDLNECDNRVTYSSSEKCASQVTLHGVVKPTETCISRLTFSNASKAKERNSENSVLLGPRLCSMRMQAGSSNILLDNATSYEPVLYTGRPSHQDATKLWNISCTRAGTAVLVHSPRSHSISSPEELSHKADGINVKSNQKQEHPPETEI